MSYLQDVILIGEETRLSNLLSPAVEFKEFVLHIYSMTMNQITLALTGFIFVSLVLS